MLWENYPISLDQLTLHDAYLTLEGDAASKIPFLVWLFENPDSLIALPGNIDLYRHDCLHLLLKRGFSPSDEAYIVGFTMGNDPKICWPHIFVFELIARFLYPHPYRFRASDLQQFRQGVAHGKNAYTKGLNHANFTHWQSICLSQLRQTLGL